MKREPAARDWRTRTAADELKRGQESATRLETLLREAPPPGVHGPDPASRALVEEVLASFARAIRALDSGERKPEDNQAPATSNAGSPRSGGRRAIAPARRGAYRRRANPYSCKTITSKTTDDGHSWRKYGQKEIYNSKFPRSYFRCTHKNDQGCEATRQVQRSEEDPTLFVITYIGEHTCGDPSKDVTWGTPYLISFGSDAPTAVAADRRQLPPLTTISSLFPISPLKQESDEEVLSSLTPVLLPPTDLGAFEGSGLMESGHSCSSSLEFDLMADSFEFDDVFSFDHEGLFRD